MRKVKELTETEVINCTTKEEAIAIINLFREAGLKWNMGDYYDVNDLRWDDYEKETYYRPTKGSYGDLEYARNRGYTIYPAKEFLEEPFPEKWTIKRTLQNAKTVNAWFMRTHPGKGILSANDPIYIPYDGNETARGSITNQYDPQPGYTVINFEQFKKYVLKQPEMPKTQTISRAGMKEIYNIACTTWKPKIMDMTHNQLDSFSDSITISEEKVAEMFKAATPGQLPVLQKYLKAPDVAYNASMLYRGEIMKCGDGNFIMGTDEGFEGVHLTGRNQGQLIRKGCGKDYLGEKVEKGLNVFIKGE